MLPAKEHSESTSQAPTITKPPVHIHKYYCDRCEHSDSESDFCSSEYHCAFVSIITEPPKDIVSNIYIYIYICILYMYASTYAYGHSFRSVYLPGLPDFGGRGAVGRLSLERRCRGPGTRSPRRSLAQGFFWGGCEGGVRGGGGGGLGGF